MKYDLKAIEGFSCAAIDVKPIDVDWSDMRFQSMWESHEAGVCEKCMAVLTVGNNGDKHSNLDDDSKCEGWVPLSEGPMMNFAYPLPEANVDPELDSIELVNLPVCIVTHEDENDRVELALTGGGMDLSWEICEAYMRLGYLPPIHFELPGMAGRGGSDRDKWIIGGYLRSCRVAEGWAKMKAERVRELANLASRVPLSKKARKR